MYATGWGYQDYYSTPMYSGATIKVAPSLLYGRAKRGSNASFHFFTGLLTIYRNVLLTIVSELLPSHKDL